MWARGLWKVRYCDPLSRRRLNQEYAGAGLGLPIARGVAEAHGGSLVLESTGPHGSTFTVTLPRAPDLPSDDELPDESAE